MSDARFDVEVELRGDDAQEFNGVSRVHVNTEHLTLTVDHGSWVVTHRFDQDAVQRYVVRDHEPPKEDSKRETHLEHGERGWQEVESMQAHAARHGDAGYRILGDDPDRLRQEVDAEHWVDGCWVRVVTTGSDYVYPRCHVVAEDRCVRIVEGTTDVDAWPPAQVEDYGRCRVRQDRFEDLDRHRDVGDGVDVLAVRLEDRRLRRDVERRLGPQR